MVEIWHQEFIDKIRKKEKAEGELYIHFPTGEYFNNSWFGDWAVIDDGTKIGRWSKIGNNSRIGDNVKMDHEISIGYKCTFGRNCSAKSVYWPYIYEPPFKVRIIYPTKNCLEHWQERLDEFGIKIQNEGCSVIRAKIIERLDELLKSNKWTKCERRILESWKNLDL